MVMCTRHFHQDSTDYLRKLNWFPFEEAVMLLKNCLVEVIAMLPLVNCGEGGKEGRSEP